MSGFSIELLEEGYRAVDPLARIRFVVKRAPDDAVITTPLAKETKGGIAPTRPSTAVPAEAKSPSSFPPPASKSGPPRPADKALSGALPKAAVVAEAPASATVAAVGSQLPGLPAVKVLSSREQDPSDASPLTYREYSFVAPAGTSEDVAAEILRGQLKIVEASLGASKMGKLVNLAVFDTEYSGKPPPPVATLTWKDWKGPPVLGYPRRGGVQKQIKPPSNPPPPMSGPQPPLGVFPDPSTVSHPPPAVVESAPPVAAPAPPIAAPEPPLASQTQPKQASVPPPPPPAPVVVPSQPPPPPPPPVVAASQPPPPPPAAFSSHPPPPAPAAFPSNPPAPLPSNPPPASRRSAPDGTIRTPSGRYVRGRTSGDELITALFESMHDLHFLRDALDGGQFCLALATEVLPARAAIIHFFDIEKREWVVACTRGKDTSRLLTLRTPEGDENLREAARLRRAIVNPTTDPNSQRYQSLGGTQSLIIAPIMQAGRALGAIELINPLDGMPFTNDEGNAMTYIAEQYAEYLGSRGIVLDRQRIQASAR